MYWHACRKRDKKGLQNVTGMIKFIIKLLLLSGSCKGPRRKRRKGNEMNQNGYHPQGMHGYGAGQNGYGAPQYTTPQVSFAQNAEQGYAQPNVPYAAPGAYAPQGSFSMPPQQNGYGIYSQQGGTGTFIPQTPYSPGYTSPDYQPQQPAYPQGGYPSQGGYPQQSGYPGGYSPQAGYVPQSGYAQGGYPSQGGYQQFGYQQGSYPQQSGYMTGFNPYGQMGRIPNQGQISDESIPLNGGGYVPKQPPVRKRGFEVKEWYLIAAGAVLIALFITAVLILKSTPLKILLILLAAGSAGMLWVKPLVAENRRLTYSIVALALCVLTAVSFLMKPNTDATRTGTNQTQGSSASQTVTAEEEGGVPEIPASVQNAQNYAESTPEPESADTKLMLQRLVTFFANWTQNRQDEMLNLCAPSWRGKQQNDRTSLFSLLQNRTPGQIMMQGTTGTDADTTRKVVLNADMSRNNGKPPETYKMTIMMVKENNEWYIDPQSLQSYETETTPDPKITPEPVITAEPETNSGTPLYFNPNGGEYYHRDQNCRDVNPKFLPLAGTFTFGQINEEPYSKLKRCNVCGAPLRPAQQQ